ncbi:dehydrogenase/reductase (sdr family) member 4 [Holotrichia oblita]|uniref:Dehydrogenase/reductase (Sdr family) member 4 n=1 Tax=Holotrichia oblita TaxID=644536 RepID=A0ACB9TP38_HOLOL|nr:dehydrogenase/reductase (sdr family) member 4 [Holotrichia oblita]
MLRIVPNRLLGKVAVVIGSSAGIGFAIAERLAKEGARVIISGRKQEGVNKALKALDPALKVLGTACHLARYNQRIRVLEMAKYAFGGLDILVINAGVSPVLHDVLDTTQRAWNKMFDINVKSYFQLAKETVPYMQERGQGKIVINADINGYHPHINLGAYAVSKGAIIALTKATALQLAKDNITVNAVAPGIISTKFSEGVRNSERADDFLKQIPQNRFGTSEEVAGPVAFLVSDDANYITGETICVAGGVVSRL